MDRHQLEALFSQVAAGDASAEEAVFHELQPRLRAIVFGRGVPGADTEDVVQEGLTAVFEQLRRGGFQGLSNPSTWAIGIVLNKVGDYFRRRGRADTLLAAATERASLSGGQLVRSTQEKRLEVMRSLARLTPIERFVLTATELTGLTYDEVAERLNCPAGTVASTKHRAITKLRDLLRPSEVRRPQLQGVADGDV